MNALLTLIDTLLNIYIFTLLAYVISSWLIAFKIVNPWQPVVRQIISALSQLHEPLLRPIRNILPNLGGLDISPILVLLALQFLRNLLPEILPK